MEKNYYYFTELCDDNVCRTVCARIDYDVNKGLWKESKTPEGTACMVPVGECYTKVTVGWSACNKEHFNAEEEINTAKEMFTSPLTVFYYEKEFFNEDMLPVILRSCCDYLYKNKERYQAKKVTFKLIQGIIGSLNESRIDEMTTNDDFSKSVTKMVEFISDQQLK